MTEVHLVKRFYAISLFALIALSIVACTRDKPADTPVPPTTIAQRTVVTAPPTPLGTVSAVDVTTPVTPTVVLTSTTPIPIVIVPTMVLPPLMTPVPTVAPVIGTADTYTVQWGDWLNKIAQQLGVTPQALIAANPGINPNLISPGQKLNVPGAASSLTPVVPGIPVPTTPPMNPSTYNVQRGEWIYAIARKFGVSVQALLAANPGINPNFLYPGQVLNIPAGSSGTPPTDPSNPPAPSGNTYTVQPGDTLYSIAVRFKTTAMALQIQNKLANPNFISPGMVLTIPQ